MCCFTRAQVTFKGVGGLVVGLTQDTLTCGVGAAASAGSGHFCVAVLWCQQTVVVPSLLVSDQSVAV